MNSSNIKKELLKIRQEKNANIDIEIAKIEAKINQITKHHANQDPSDSYEKTLEQLNGVLVTLKSLKEL